LKNPERPLMAILGGAKVSDKLPVVKNLLGLVEKILIGGGMAYTFLKVIGSKVGKSLVEEDTLKDAEEALAVADSMEWISCCPWITWWRTASKRRRSTRWWTETSPTDGRASTSARPR